jgi:hypothetical protein
VIHFDLTQVSEIVLVQLRDSIREQRKKLRDDEMLVVAEIIRRRGGINQMTLDVD